MTDSAASSAQSQPDVSRFPARWNWIDVVLLLLVVIGSVFLHMSTFDSELSFDELWHLSTTQGHGSQVNRETLDVLLTGLTSQTSIEHAAPFWMIWAGMDGVLHPPLYCMTLRLWREAFGGSDFVAHCYSTAWATVGLAFLFATARMAMDRWIALLVCVGMTISPVQLYFAQEVRSYAMMIALGTIALWIMTRVELLGPTRRRAILLALITLPLLLTHYFSAGAVIAIGLYGFARLRGHRSVFLITCAIAGLIYLSAWVPFGVKQLADLGTGDSFLHVASFDVLRETLLLGCAPFRVIIDQDYNAQRLTLLSGLLFVAPWFLVRRLRPLLPWAIWLTCSILAIALLDAERSSAHLTYSRYFSVASPAVLLLVVGIAWGMDRRTAYVIGFGLIGLIAFAGYAKNSVVLDSPFYSTARNVVRDRIGPADALLIYHGSANVDYNHMIAMTFSHDVTFQRRPTILMTRPLSEEIARKLPARAWLVSGGFQTPLDQLISGAKMIERLRVGDEAMLYCIELQRPEPPATQPSATQP